MSVRPALNEILKGVFLRRKKMIVHGSQTFKKE